MSVQAPQEHTDFSVTARAAQRIAALSEQETGGKAAMRVTVLAGGCNGFQYTFGFDETRNEDDVAFEAEGATVLIDTMSLEFLRGGVLDYTQELIGSAFVITNPNAASSCGCGTSFSV